MTLDQIVTELEKLDVDFALVTRDRAAGLGGESLNISLREDGSPAHPAHGAWLLCRGVQRALDLCDYDLAWAADVSKQTAELTERLSEWKGI